MFLKHRHRRKLQAHPYYSKKRSQEAQSTHIEYFFVSPSDLLIASLSTLPGILHQPEYFIWSGFLSIIKPDHDSHHSLSVFSNKWFDRAIRWVLSNLIIHYFHCICDFEFALIFNLSFLIDSLIVAINIHLVASWLKIWNLSATKTFGICRHFNSGAIEVLEYLFD